MGDGKFFCGLTEKMMRKQPSTGPNRQKSSLFWDDDSDAESGADSRRTTRRDQAANVPDTSVNYGGGNNRVEPKSSFQKEMTSKIDFFHNDDNYNKNNNKTTNNQVKQSNTNNYTSQETNRYNACKSNIQFFDYPNDDEVVTSRRRTNNTIQMENDKNTFPNSSKTYDKHITFIENKVSDRSSSPKGILKNKINFISKKDNGNNKKNNEIIFKKNKSKSFENLISRSESAPNLNEDVPIDNVKNIRIENDNDDEIHDKNKIQLESKSKRNFQDNILEKHHKNIEQNNSYSKTKHIQNHTIINNPYGMDQYSERSNKLNTTPKLRKGILRSNQSEKQMVEENSTELPDSFHTTHEQHEQQPPTTNHKIRHPPSQRHLVSNISFCQEENTNGHQQPTRIRSSAFTRVSVGLPD